LLEKAAGCCPQVRALDQPGIGAEPDAARLQACCVERATIAR
jgi:hypothetical protein